MQFFGYLYITVAHFQLEFTHFPRNNYERGYNYT